METRKRQVSSGDDLAVIGSAPGRESPATVLGDLYNGSSYSQEVSEREQLLQRELALAKLEIARLKLSAEETGHGSPAAIEQRPQSLSKPPELPVIASTSVMSDLPKVELFPFDGNPVDYWKFIKQFEFYVESKTGDPGQRLLYLLHYCRGRARKAIDACLMLPPHEGYLKARGTLRDLFGLPHVIARSLLDELLAEAKHVRNTSDSLSGLALKMDSCLIALMQMNYEADLNSITTLEGIVKCLPFAMQQKWAEIADRINTDGNEVTFEHLTNFISERARVARSRFGQLLERPHAQPTRTIPPFKGESSKLDGRRINVTSRVPSKPDPVCCLCQASHNLWSCPKFLEADVKFRWDTAKRKSLCFVCLRQSHNAALCNSKTWCTVGQCGKRHHTLLHYESSAVEAPGKICNSTLSNTKVYLGTIPVKLETPIGLVSVLALLDGGSDTTLIREDFVKRYGLPSVPEEVSISTLGHHRKMRCSRLTINIHSFDEKETIQVPDAYTVKSLPDVPYCCPEGFDSQHTYLKGVEFNDIDDRRVTMLIGCDVPEAHWVLEQRVGGIKQPFATRTPLGWIIQGPASTTSKTSLSIQCQSGKDVSLTACIERLYDAEFSDLSADGPTWSLDDKRALSIVEHSRLVDGHFHVPLPWKTNAPRLDDNYALAERRLTYLRRRFERDPTLFERYSRVMQHHFDIGYIERVPTAKTGAQRVWHLPHHPVLNPKKPEKLRVVFDCAAKYHGYSLNDLLLQGPNLTNNLVEVLLRFRLHPYAVAADIEEMFLQVVVPPDDRDALRVLWWESNDFNRPVETFRMTVHPFGATSSPFCATYALRKSVECFGHLFDKSIGEYICNNFYVDDCLLSVPTKAEAKCAIDQLGRLLKLCGFRLTKWVANDYEVIDSIPLEERASSLRTITADKLPIERMLGVKWDASTDEFAFNFELPKRPSTRRGLLSAVSSMYDPLGMMSPWILPGKELLQRSCRQKLSWDEFFNEELQKLLDKWISGMHEIKETRVPRPICAMGDCATAVEIHVFSDASEVGHGAVAYACPLSGPVRLPTRLLFSKSRVNPLKAVPIPRLELNAAVLAVRISLIIKHSFGEHVTSVNFWTDSMLVLHYINNRSTRFSTFVANRLTYIHDHTLVSQWRHVDTRLNPADLTSRGETDLTRKELWLNGPEFLRLHPDQWPFTINTGEGLEHVELKRTVCISHKTKSCDGLSSLLCRFSDWMKLLRSVAWLMRFKSYLLVKAYRDGNRHVNTGPLRVDELRCAEYVIIRLIQREAFGPELSSATRDPPTSIIPNSLKKLRPYIDCGVIRVGGRLQRSSLNESSKHPILLPRKQYVTGLIIRYVHVFEGHAGPAHTMSVLRKKYWLIGGLSSVKRELGLCFKCKRLNARCGEQLMSELPAVRVTSDFYPFANTGVDYFGPFNVKRGRSLEKRYGCLLVYSAGRFISKWLIV